MTETFVSRQVRRVGLRKVCYGAIALLAVAGILWLSWGYYYNFFVGPSEIGRAELLAASTPDDLPRDYIVVHGDESVTTGVQEITTTRARRTGRVTSRATADYIVLRLDDRFLLVKAPPGELKNSYAGKLSAVLSRDEQQFFSDLRRQDPQLHAALLPMILDATESRMLGYIGLVVMLVLSIVGLLQLRSGVLYLSNPQRHPIFTGLARFGNAGERAAQIDAELRSGEHVVKLGQTTITRSWVIDTHGSDVKAISLGELAWFYPQVTQERVNGFAAGKTHMVHLNDRHGVTLSINCKRDQRKAEQLLAELARRLPWAFMGYDTQLEQAWRLDRAAVLAALDQRRSQYAQLQRGSMGADNDSSLRAAQGAVAGQVGDGRAL